MFLNQHTDPVRSAQCRAHCIGILGGRRLSAAGVQYRLKQYCRQAGVSLSCHQLRHTFARRLTEKGMPIDSLAKLLGHSDLNTTQLYIDGANPAVREDFLQAMQSLDLLFQTDVCLPGDLLQAPFPPAARDDRPNPEMVIAKLQHHRDAVRT